MGEDEAKRITKGLGCDQPEIERGANGGMEVILGEIFRGSRDEKNSGGKE